MFKPLFTLFPPEALESTRRSGMFALSEPGRLDEALAAASLEAIEDDEIEFPVMFDSARSAGRAFIGAGPMALAIGHSGEAAVGDAIGASLRPFTDPDGPDGEVSLPAWYRVILTQAKTRSSA